MIHLLKLLASLAVGIGLFLVCVVVIAAVMAVLVLLCVPSGLVAPESYDDDPDRWSIRPQDRG